MKNETAFEILKPLIWKIGKSNGEPLWSHQMTAFLIFKKFQHLNAIPYCDEKKKTLLELSILLHDLKKSAEWNQMILRGETDVEKIIAEYQKYWKLKQQNISDELPQKKRLFKSGKTDHQISNQLDKEFFLLDYLSKIKHNLDFELSDIDIDNIFDIIQNHFISDDNIKQSTLSAFGNYTKILQYCDRLASIKSIDYDLIDEIRNINIGRKIFDITYFQISRSMSPSAALLYDCAVETYKKNGWDVLLLVDNGVIFICENEKQIPDKNQIIEQVANKFFEQMFENMTIEFGRENIFVGAAESNPLVFLQIKKDILKG